MRNYSLIVKPIYDSIANYHKTRRIVWTPETTAAFHGMKLQVKNDPLCILLATLHRSRCIRMNLIMVWMNQTVDGIDQPIAFVSKSHMYSLSLREVLNVS